MVPSSRSQSAPSTPRIWLRSSSSAMNSRRSLCGISDLGSWLKLSGFPLVVGVPVGVFRHERGQAALFQLRLEGLANPGVLVGIFDLILGDALGLIAVGQDAG